jgi:hypothetical protein
MVIGGGGGGDALPFGGCSRDCRRFVAEVGLYWRR